MDPLPPDNAWTGALHQALDGLEHALLGGDPGAVERASAALAALFQRRPPLQKLPDQGTALKVDIERATRRFALLRQAVLRGAAQSERAVHSLLPKKAPGTYGRLAGQNPSTGGAGRDYLSA
jgi:hypothetical protein